MILLLFHFPINHLPGLELFRKEFGVDLLSFLLLPLVMFYVTVVNCSILRYCDIQRYRRPGAAAKTGDIGFLKPATLAKFASSACELIPDKRDAINGIGIIVVTTIINV